MKYSPYVWDPHTSFNVRKGSRKGLWLSPKCVCITVLQNNLSWPTLQQLKLSSKTLLLHNILLFITCPHNSIILFSNSNLTKQFHTLATLYLSINSCNLLYQHSFYLDKIMKWNNFPNQLIDLTSYSQFLSDLYNYLVM